MNVDEIGRLVELLDKSSLAELQWSSEGERLLLKKQGPAPCGMNEVGRRTAGQAGSPTLAGAVVSIQSANVRARPRRNRAVLSLVSSPCSSNRPNAPPT